MTGPGGRRRWAAAAAVVVLAVAGGGLVLVLNRGRPWMTPDAVTYLGVAENLAAGRGVTAPFRNTLDPFSARPSDAVPLLRWPPGYPLAVGALVLVGLTPATAAVVVNVAGVGALVVLMALTAHRATGRPGVAVAAAALAAGTGAVLPSSRYALSEVLFVSVVAAFLHAALRTAQGHGRLPWGMAAAVSAATMVRWAGIALVVPAVAACWIGRHSWRRAAVAVAVPVGVVALWSAVLALTADEQPRRLAWHPGLDPGGLLVATGALVDPRAVLPGGWALLGLVAVSGLGIAAAATVAAVAGGRRPRPLLTVAAAAGLAYLGVLLVSRALLDAAIPWDDRLLGPLYPVLVLALVAVAGGRWRSPVAGGVGWAALALVAAGQIAGLPALLRAADEPVGYTSAWWEAVPMAEVERALDPFPVLASNRPDVAWLHLHRSALTVPRVLDPATGRANGEVDAELAALARTLAPGGGLVWFDDPSNPRAYLAAEAEVVQALGLRPVGDFTATRVYAAPVSAGGGP